MAFIVIHLLPHLCLSSVCRCVAIFFRDEVIRKVFRSFHRIPFTHVSVPSYDAVLFTVLLRLSDDPLYSVFSYINLVIIHIFWSSNRLAEVSRSRFGAFRRSLFFVIVINVCVFGLARIEHVNVFVGHCS